MLCLKKWGWLVLSGLIIIIDQLSKGWVVDSLTPYQPWQLITGLNLTLAYNPGAAFSFLSSGGWNHWFLTAFSLGMSCVLLIWLIRLPQQAWLQGVAISLILGGAIGNLYDRAFLGYVIDFIQVYYKNYYWPVFNLADSAICLGTSLLIIDLIKNKS